MSQVKIAKEIPFNDVTLGLTLLCGPADGKQADLQGVTDQLRKFDHDTVFAEAFRIAAENKRKIFGRNATFNEFMSDYDGRDALFFSAPGDNPVVGAICGGATLSPNEEMAPSNNADQTLFILTAIGIATTESNPEDDEPYVEPDSETIH
jgi:hypothetical protein